MQTTTEWVRQLRAAYELAVNEGRDVFQFAGQDFRVDAVQIIRPSLHDPVDLMGVPHVSEANTTSRKEN